MFDPSFSVQAFELFPKLILLYLNPCENILQANKQKGKCYWIKAYWIIFRISTKKSGIAVAEGDAKRLVDQQWLSTLAGVN
jgi:hypothetical protein